MTSIAILGASGPTGIHLAAELRKRGAVVRVVARARNRLERLFPDASIGKHSADITNREQTLRAIEGCDLVYDCIGIDGDQMHLHPVTAACIAYALKQTKARCVYVSSFWPYLPLQVSPLNEKHPRSGGPPWVRYRRTAEDILKNAGAAVLHLPDFYGTYVHTSILQNALVEAAAGKTVNWLGSIDTPREHIDVAEAMRIAADIADHDGAFGEHWVLPGSGPLTGRQVAAIASDHLGRPVKIRGAGMTMLRVVSWFNKDLRGFMQVVPDYLKPIAYDASKLQSLIGKPHSTDYKTGIARTLDWIKSQSPNA